MTALDAAIEYHGRGWAPIPVPLKAKAPVIEGWPNLRFLENQLPDHFAGQTNIGVLLGTASGGLVDVDLDCQHARAVAPYLLPITGLTFGRQGAPESHWIYVAEPTIASPRKFKDPVGGGDRANLLELRSGTNKGIQTIFPPSVHPTGEPIVWHQFGEPERISARDLERSVVLVAAASLLARHWPAAGSRHDAAMALAGGLARAGWGEAVIERVITAIAAATGDEEHHDRVRAVMDTVARHRNQDPTTGWVRLAELIGQAHGRDVVPVVCEWLNVPKPDFIRAAPKEVERARIEFPDPVPASQLGNGQEFDWVWHGWIACGYVTLLVGLWKAGKTTLLSHLLAAAGSGGAIAGSIRQSRCLVISEEASGLWSRRCQEIGIADHVEFLIRPIKGRPGLAQWEALIEYVEQLVREKEFDLVIFDTFAAFNPVPDENNAAAMMSALMPLQSITNAGAAVLLSHHPRKGDGSEGQAARGSGALTGFVDIIIEFRRYAQEEPEDARRVLKGLSRFDETAAEAVIELTENGYVGLGTKGEVSQEERLETIETVLAASTLAMTADEVRTDWLNTGTRPGLRTVQHDLNSGVDKGRWTRSGRGVKGDPFRYKFDSRTVHPLSTGIEYESREPPTTHSDDADWTKVA